MNIETKWLLDFLVLAETLSFSQASKLRHVTQSAFSRRIQSLENRLDCELICRSKHPISLTQNGVKFKHVAKTVLAGLEQGIAELG
jgi:DNA-binding transcriptional LysR family regulator